MGNSDFFNTKNFDLKYPERAVLIESISWNAGEDKPKAKIRIPILMPMSDSDEIKETTYRQTTNENGKTVSGTVSSVNYLLLDIPTYLYDTHNIVDYDSISTLNYHLSKGTEFIVVFIGGSLEIEDIKIIGRI